MTTAFEVDRNELSMNELDIDGLLWYRRVECLPTDAEVPGSILGVDLRLLQLCFPSSYSTRPLDVLFFSLSVSFPSHLTY